MSKIFILGAGRMASAIAGGAVKTGAFPVDCWSAFDPDPVAQLRFTQATGVACVDDLVSACREAEIVLLAIKPQVIERALKPLTGCFSGKLIISIAAGVSLAKLESLTGSSRIVRVMPNTPALVGFGAAAFAPASGVAADDIKLVEKLFSSIGTALQVGENLMDAVTGLSGSGPAYVFAFIQALADGGVAEGLSRENALALAAQTVKGAAEMVMQTGVHPMVLCDQVTSPGGTTSRGLEVLATDGFSGTVIKAVRSAASRSKELGK